MFEFVFPIFCFGLVVTGIVVKGLFTAADAAEARRFMADQEHPEPDATRHLEIASRYERQL